MAAGSMPIYRVTVIERTTKAINYQSPQRSYEDRFPWHPLLPEARGEAKVESKQGYIEIEVEFDDLQAGHRYGRRVPHLRVVGRHPRRPHSQPGRGPPEWNQEQAERDHRVAVVRHDGDGGTLFRGDTAQRRRGDGERDQRRYARGRSRRSTRSTNCCRGGSTSST